MHGVSSRSQNPIQRREKTVSRVCRPTTDRSPNARAAPADPARQITLPRASKEWARLTEPGTQLQTQLWRVKVNFSLTTCRIDKRTFCI